MPYNIKKKLKAGLFIALFVLIGGYAYARSNALRKGVLIEVHGVMDGETVTEGTLHISGTATHAASLSLNDRPLSVDQEGAFAEELLLVPGYTIITFKAEDRFGKKTEKMFHVLYTPMHVETPPTPIFPDETPLPAAPEAEEAQGTIIIN